LTVMLQALAALAMATAERRQRAIPP